MVPGVIGCLQAMEVVKYVLGIGNLLTGRLLIYDGLSLEFVEVTVKASVDCRECNPHFTTRTGVDNGC